MEFPIERGIEITSTIYFVGYSVSLTALVGAVFILGYFK